jgi:type II secretory pathway component HofQ
MGPALLLILTLATSGAEEARVSLDAREAPAVEVIRVLAEVGSFQTVIDPGVSCSLTLNVSGLPWLTVLDLTLRACGLAREADGDVIRIATRSRLLEESTARRRLAAEQQAARPLDLHLIHLSYARAEAIAPLLKRLLAPRGSVTYDSRTNTLMVVD